MYVLWLLCVCWCAGALASEPALYRLDDVSTLYQEFKAKYGKNYTPEEALQRLEIFISNMAKINRLNRDNPHAVYAMNQFMDLTPEELKKRYKGLSSKSRRAKTGLHKDIECNVLTDDDISATGAPEAYDWVAEGAVTGDKDQEGCGSCWAFSATGHLEGRNFIKHNKLLNLSQQQLLDCDTFSDGCKGGSMENAFRSLISKGGSMTAEDYPYVPENRTGTCKFDKDKVVVKVTRCTRYELRSQDKVKQLLHEIGPIPIAIRSEGLDFYKSGIISDEACSAGDLDHAVLLVGYGTATDGDYWLVKMWYGGGWGESGYFRMQRGENNTSCGMLNDYMSTADIE